MQHRPDRYRAPSHEPHGPTSADRPSSASQSGPPTTPRAIHPPVLEHTPDGGRRVRNSSWRARSQARSRTGATCPQSIFCPRMWTDVDADADAGAPPPQGAATAADPFGDLTDDLGALFGAGASAPAPAAPRPLAPSVAAAPAPSAGAPVPRRRRSSSLVVSRRRSCPRRSSLLLVGPSPSLVAPRRSSSFSSSLSSSSLGVPRPSLLVSPRLFGIRTTSGHRGSSAPRRGAQRDASRRHADGTDSRPSPCPETAFSQRFRPLAEGHVGEFLRFPRPWRPESSAASNTDARLPPLSSGSVSKSELTRASEPSGSPTCGGPSGDGGLVLCVC